MLFLYNIEFTTVFKLAIRNIYFVIYNMVEYFKINIERYRCKNIFCIVCAPGSMTMKGILNKISKQVGYDSCLYNFFIRIGLLGVMYIRGFNCLRRNCSITECLSNQ